MDCDTARKKIVESPSKSPYKHTRPFAPQRWEVGMTVAYRETPTVEATLQSLVDAGFKLSRVTLFIEPGTNGLGELSSQTNRIYNEDVLGNWGNFKRRTEHFARNAYYLNSATKFLFVQDDVEFLPNTRQWVEEHWPCNDGVLSLYRSGKYNVLKPNELWGVLPHGKVFLGALAIVLPKNLLIALAENLPAMDDGVNRKDDVKFGTFCHTLNIPVNIVNASRCQHTGVVSSLYPTPGKLSTTRMATTYVK